MIRIDPRSYFFGALLILLLPLDWLMAAVGAAAFHELCHALGIYLLGGKIKSVCISVGGAVMETEIPGKGRELLCALAGPMGSLLLITFCHIFPKLAICAGVQGIFNLLPVYPLDGGRAVRCCLDLCIPQKAEGIQITIEIMALISLAALAAAGTFVLSMGILPLFVTALFILKAILRKRPCKRKRFGVQ